MTAVPQRLADYLRHIVEAIERINRYTTGMSGEAFKCDELVQDAVVRNLEVIGEACRNIDRADPDFAARHPELPLVAAYEMRNVLAHGYFKLDMGIVWNTLQRELPALQRQVLKLQADLPPESG